MAQTAASRPQPQHARRRALRPHPKGPTFGAAVREQQNPPFALSSMGIWGVRADGGFSSPESRVYGSAEAAEKAHALHRLSSTPQGIGHRVSPHADVIRQNAQAHRRGKAPRLIPGYRAVCWKHRRREPMVPPWQGTWIDAAEPGAYLSARIEAILHNRAAHSGKKNRRSPQ
jgi:hypothetical protein